MNTDEDHGNHGPEKQSRRVTRGSELYIERLQSFIAESRFLLEQLENSEVVSAECYEVTGAAFQAFSTDVAARWPAILKRYHTLKPRPLIQTGPTRIITGR